MNSEYAHLCNKIDKIYIIWQNKKRCLIFLYRGSILESSINKKYSSKEISRIIDEGIKESEIRKFFTQPGDLPYSEVKKIQAEFCRFIGY